MKIQDASIPAGITLGLGGPVRENAIEMMKKFKEKGALISFDVNFGEFVDRR